MNKARAYMGVAYWITLSSLLASCSAMPAFGPDARAITSAAAEGATVDEDALQFNVVEVTASTLPVVSETHARFPTSFQTQGFRRSDEVVGVGDQIEIRIWEVADNGLFATAGNRETVINVSVSNSGIIVVPYADAITALGLTTLELRRELLVRYRGQAVEPEISVAITSTEARSVTVLGNVRNPGRIEIPPRGIRLLDLLASTGGASETPWEVRVSVQRGTTIASLLLSNIASTPTNNIVILPGDTVNVSHEPRRFTVYGGVGRPTNVEIPLEVPHLAYLLAEVGGLNNQVAQPRSIFVFRPSSGGHMPIAYRFDFSRPDALLLARDFRLAANDIVYVASAGTADFKRFMSIVISPIFSLTSEISNIGN